MTEPRRAAEEVIGRLGEAGHVAYLAGGCVRDLLLGIEPKDFDVATDARPEEVRRVFPRARSVGESFGVMLVRRSGHVIEIATFRADGPYDDGRRPRSVEFSDAAHDALRRDFTINGLFQDPATGSIIDYVDGRADLDARVIRAIGDPDARIAEDRLRMLRAVRFAARYGFEIEPGTAAAIARHAAELAGVSRERIGIELRGMMSGPGRARAIGLIHALGLDASVLLEAGRPDVPLPRLAALPPDASFPGTLAAWHLDRAEGVPVPAAPAPSAAREAAERWSAALVLSNDERRGLVGRLEDVAVLRTSWRDLRLAGRKRQVVRTSFPEALAIRIAEAPAEAAELQDEVAALRADDPSPAPLLDGNDLRAAGLPQGPLYARLLAAVYDAQLEGRIATRGEAIDLARRLAAADAT